MIHTIHTLHIRTHGEKKKKYEYRKPPLGKGSVGDGSGPMDVDKNLT